MYIQKKYCTFLFIVYINFIRDITQSGSVSVLGTECHVFESRYPDYINMEKINLIIESNNNIHTIFYIIISFILIIIALNIVFTSDIIKSLLLLITAFFLGSCILLSIHAEFMAFVLLIIYVGAIIVLFLFTIMMINLKKIDSSNLNKNKLIGFLIFFSLGQKFIFNIYMNYFKDMIPNNTINYNNENILNNSKYPLEYLLKNNEAFFIGFEMFNNQTLSVILIGLILFVGLIGSLVLTITPIKKVKKQFISQQVSRNPKNVLKK